MPHEVQVQSPIDTRNPDPLSPTRVEPPSSQVHQDESQVHGDDHGRSFDQGGAQGGEAREEESQIENDDDGPINVNLKHHIEDFIKWFNGFTLLTTSLGLSKEG
jgi:hypothetical protein